METEVKAFETSDAKLVAYLFCLKFSLVKPPYLKGTAVVFSFPDTPEVNLEVQNFKNKTTKDVGLAFYGSKLAHVKALVYNYRRLEAREELGGDFNE